MEKEQKLSAKEFEKKIVENLCNMTSEQVVQADVMIKFFKSRKVKKEERAALETRIEEHKKKRESNQEFLDFLATL